MQINYSTSGSLRPWLARVVSYPFPALLVAHALRFVRIHFQYIVEATGQCGSNRYDYLKWISENATGLDEEFSNGTGRSLQSKEHRLLIL